jgi:hypothetical protein
MSPDELRGQSADLFARRHGDTYARTARSNERVIAEIPSGPGKVLRISWYESSPRNREPNIGFSIWQVRPDGFQFPYRGLGFTVGIELLPGIVEAVAKLMELERARMPVWAGGDDR